MSATKQHVITAGIPTHETFSLKLLVVVLRLGSQVESVSIVLSQIEADFYPHRVGFDEQVGQEKASSLH